MGSSGSLYCLLWMLVPERKGLEFPAYPCSTGNDLLATWSEERWKQGVYRGVGELAKKM